MTVSLQVRVPEHIARRVRVLAAQMGAQPRDVVLEALLDHFGWPQDEPAPVDGQLTVDEAQEPIGSRADANAAASRRPRAAEDTQSNGSPSAESPARPPDPDEPTGCPDCSGDVVEGKCTDCGWLQ